MDVSILVSLNVGIPIQFREIYLNQIRPVHLVVAIDWFLSHCSIRIFNMFDKTTLGPPWDHPWDHPNNSFSLLYNHSFWQFVWCQSSVQDYVSWFLKQFLPHESHTLSCDTRSDLFFDFGERRFAAVVVTLDPSYSFTKPKRGSSRSETLHKPVEDVACFNNGKKWRLQTCSLSFSFVADVGWLRNPAI